MMSGCLPFEAIGGPLWTGTATDSLGLEVVWTAN